MRAITAEKLIKELQELKPDDVLGVWYCVKEDLEEEVANNDYELDILTPTVLKKLWERVSNCDYVWENMSQTISEELNSILEEITDPNEQELWEA